MLHLPLTQFGDMMNPGAWYVHETNYGIRYCKPTGYHISLLLHRLQESISGKTVFDQQKSIE